MPAKRFATALAAILCLAPFSAGMAGAGDLTTAELERELVGRSILWWEEGGWHRGHLMLGRDGTAELSVDDPAPAGDTGRWAIRDGQICTVWGDLRAGREKCYSVRRGDGGEFVTSGGNIFAVREAGV